MKVVYPGPHAGVRILATGQVATQGEPVDVPDAVAASLLEQGWELVAPKPGKPPVKKAAPAADKE